MAQKKYSPAVEELLDLIAKNGWEDKFQKALDACHALNTIEYENIKTLDDYYDWLEGLLHWVPVENTPRHSCLHGRYHFLLPA